MSAPLNPCELEIDLFCKGLKMEPKRLGAMPPAVRAGWNGLELVIPGDLKDIRVNVPVSEPFVDASPYALHGANAAVILLDERSDTRYPVHLVPTPTWSRCFTTRGTPMHKVGTLQGTCLGVPLTNSCTLRYHSPDLGCRFCTTGVDVPPNHFHRQEIDDVVETAWAAKEESGVVMVHLDNGFVGQDRDLDLAAPYVTALKERVGVLTGLQVSPSRQLWKYDWLMDCGVDRFSFGLDFNDPRTFADLCPGKDELIGRRAFFDAVEYTTSRLGKGRVSTEIIAGVEPIEETLAAIDHITAVGAMPDVHPFRPIPGSEMAHVSPPRFEDILVVMGYAYDACLKNEIPFSMIPAVEVSGIIGMDDTRYLPERNTRWKENEARLTAWRGGSSPGLDRELRPHPVKGDPFHYPAYAPR